MPRTYTTRKRRTTKKVYRKRRPYNMTRKKYGKSGFLKMVRWSNNDFNSNVHYVVVGDNAVNSGVFATTFALSQVAGSAEIKSLFDNYRITRVMYRFLIKRDPSQNAGAITGNGLFPSIRWVHDFNDSAAISKVQMMQHAAMREFYFTEQRQHSKWYSLKPALLSTTYESGVTNAYSPVWRRFLDTSDDTAPHYGLKCAWDNAYSGMIIQIEAKLVIECKGIS